MTDPVTPPVADAAFPEGIVIPEAVKATFPDLIPQVLASPSMDLNEKNYWFSVLPIMNAEQVGELRDILASEQKRLAQEAGDQPAGEEAEVDLIEAERRRQERRLQMRESEKQLTSQDSAEAEALLGEL